MMLIRYHYNALTYRVDPDPYVCYIQGVRHLLQTLFYFYGNLGMHLIG